MRHWIFLILAAPLLAEGDRCPGYPVAARTVLQEKFQRLSDFSRYHVAGRETPRAVTVPPSNNFIDESVFGLMSRDGVQPAGLTTDGEFLRRVYLDLTGRIPTYDQTQAFLASNQVDRDRRSKVVESLLASTAYVDQFSYWFRQRFQIVPKDGFLSHLERNHFYDFVRKFVATDAPYDGFVRALLTASGDSDIEPAMAFLGRRFVQEAPSQDSWDEFTNVAASQFLGIKIDCISCHDGRRHLEKINLDLTSRRRRDFWQLAAFFSRTRFRLISDDSASYRPRLIFFDSPTGLYNGAINPSQPGARPPRAGANETPLYWLTGQEPANDNWRQEFARILTADRQFARASVNWLWSYFFGSGIVDPPDGWDMRRVDPATPPPEGWPSQNVNPELLEALTDRFIQSGYSLKAMIRLIVNSNAYQLSSRYPAGAWNAAYAGYFARHEARRLSAEQMVDSLITATGTQTDLYAYGMPGVVMHYANQLPHPNVSQLNTLLAALGQGDWINQLPSNKPSLYGVLDFFNSWFAEVHTRATASQHSPQSNAAAWLAAGLSDSEILQRMFLATLTRPPTAAESQAIQSNKLNDRQMWLSSVQWALVQKIDFVFNY